MADDAIKVVEIMFWGQPPDSVTQLLRHTRQRIGAEGATESEEADLRMEAGVIDLNQERLFGSISIAKADKI
ncbi:MAG: hypothetical protein Q9215_003506 [Flavoplaca cf. flavocitrina]